MRLPKKTQTIRRRLQLSLILLTILPVLASSLGMVVVGYYFNRQRAIEQLESVIALKYLELSNWSNAVQEILKTTIDEEIALEQTRAVLNSSAQSPLSEGELTNFRSRFMEIIARATLPQLDEMFLVDSNGRIIVSTVSFHEGQTISDRQFFINGMQSPAFQISSQSAFLPWSEGLMIFAARPIIDEHGTAIGVIAIKLGPRSLLAILAERTGLGRTGNFYLSRSVGILLLPGGEAPRQVSGINLLQDLKVLSPIPDIESRVGFPGSYSGVNGQPVIGFYRRMDELNLLLAAEQNQTEVFETTYASLGMTAGISIISILLAVMVSILITRSITKPLNELAEAAAQVAQGSLDRRVQVFQGDEVGVVAATFNSMANQLQDLVTTLEQRVTARTGELQEANQNLQRHSLSLETSAKVSQEISSILALDELLKRVVDLIKVTFGYYHINILLHEGDELVLKARSGQVGPVLARFPLDKVCLNTTAFRNNQAILANDVSTEPLFFPDPALPDVSAELIIPLRVGDKVIGTMDVNSEKVNAFTQQDMLILQGLGSQVAIAIENAHLYERSRELAIVEERNRLARNLHDSVSQSLASLNIMIEGWRRMVQVGEPYAIETFLDRAAQITDQSLKELRLMVHELRPSALGEAGLVEALHHRLDYVESRAGIEARLVSDDLPDLPLQVEEELYWIAREALNNALKHSSASQVTVYLATEGNHLLLKVVDNGRGFEYNEGIYRCGVGLSSMAERAQQLKAEMTVVSAPGAGTTVQVSVPVESIS